MAAASANEGYFEIVCKGNSSTCLDALLDVMPELQYIEVPDDGDCFFHSIAAYYKRTGRHVDGLVNPTNSQALREFVAQHFLNMFENDPDLSNAILERDHNDVLRLFEEGFWVGDVCDLMIQRIPRILNINLNVYGVNKQNVKNDSPFAITRSSHVPIHHVNNIPTINLFLSKGHYGLLYPVGGDNVRSQAQIRANDRVMATYMAKKAAKEQEYERGLEEYLRNEAAKARNALRTSRKVKPTAKSVAKPVAKRNSRKAKPSAANSQNNNNMRAAMEESYAMEASHVNNIANIERQFAALESGMKPSRRNQIAALQQQISQLELKKKRPGVSRKNPVNNMSAAFANVSLRNRNNSFDCDNATVPKLIEYLKSRGYEGPPPLYKINRPELLIMCRDLRK
jgi:hypothetical protein